jgi:hypothetical protein
MRMSKQEIEERGRKLRRSRLLKNIEKHGGAHGLYLAIDVITSQYDISSSYDSLIDAIRRSDENTNIYAYRIGFAEGWAVW